MFSCKFIFSQMCQTGSCSQWLKKKLRKTVLNREHTVKLFTSKSSSLVSSFFISLVFWGVELPETTIPMTLKLKLNTKLQKEGSIFQEFFCNGIIYNPAKFRKNLCAGFNFLSLSIKPKGKLKWGWHNIQLK